jgi:putative DNA primase/helicase
MVALPEDQAPVEEPGKHHKPTDDEIGDFLIEKWSGNVRFFFGAWYRYKAGVWLPIKALEKAIWEQLKDLKYVGIRPTASKVASVEKYLQHYLSVDDEKIDAQREYINLRNGLFNVESMRLEPHNRETFMTSQLAFDYDEEADCPTFRKFLNDALIRPDGNGTDYDLQMLILEAMGYSLTSSTDFRVSFWLVGESGTGKSVLINTLQELAGNSHVTIDLDQLSQNPYQLADIAGKRVVTFTEPRANSVLADNHYKRLVSQDAIMARQIFGKPFRFVPMCKVWGAMNDLPRVVDRSDAIFNRVFLIPMNHVIPVEKRDTRLTEKLRGEMSGIFNLALIGLKRLKKARAFTRCDQVEAARDEYKAENDTELAFVQDWCDISDTTAAVEAQRLYDAYASWCRRNGAMAKSSTKVARDWQRLGFTRKRSAGTWYIGIKLNHLGEKHGT